MTSLNEALGTELAAQYNTLSKEKPESLKDSQAARDYVNAVIRRWAVLKTLKSDSTQKIDKQTDFMRILESHVTGFVLAVSSNPAEITNWLKAVDCPETRIFATLRIMEQPGCGEDTPGYSAATCGATSETCNGSSSQGGTTHYHSRSVNAGPQGVACNPYSFYSPEAGMATAFQTNRYDPVDGPNVHGHVVGSNVHGYVVGSNVHGHVVGSNVHGHVGAGSNVFGH